jgi:hypothetical protein
MFSRIAKALQICFASPRRTSAKQRDFLTSPVRLLRSGKSTPTSSAAYAVDQAVRSAVDPDVLHAVDSAVGQIFYDTVYWPTYLRIWRAICDTWANQGNDTLSY